VIDAAACGRADAQGVFDSEFRSLVSLIHPNIITIFDLFESGDLLYLILEYAEGGSLSDRLHGGESLPPAAFAPLARQIVGALAYCHSEGIAHGDIKPANILLDHYGRPKLADFGLAARYAPGENPRHCGSPSYMAPELLARRARDPFACDVWALGVTFYELLAGQRPFVAPSPEAMLREIVCTRVQFAATVPPALALLISQMLSFDPRLRPTMAQLLDAPVLAAQPQKTVHARKLFRIASTHHPTPSTLVRTANSRSFERMHSYVKPFI
jgi:5'-AMP-activated protein kinase catalytic alpha subunit